MITLDNLSKRFGKVEAVKNLNLNIKDKEFFGLLGPSGCGKTTTLRCIAGLETPDEGKVFIGGRDVTDLSPADRNIAMVFQSYALYPHMTVFDNIAFPLRIRKRPKDEIKREVKKVAETLKISEFLDRKPRELSGGQRQRVALGRSMIRNPKVFLLDEPLANLDAKLRLYMRAELKRLQKQLKVTTILVTHDQVEAITMTDRLAVMNEGEIKQVSSSYELYKHPRDTFVAGFLGAPAMNLIECSLVEKNGVSSLDFSSGTLPIPSSIEKILSKKIKTPELILGIRPDDISLYKKKRGPNFHKAKVYIVESLGVEKLFTVEVGNNYLKVKTGISSEWGVGEDIWICFNWDKIYLFDGRSKKSLM